MDFVQGMRSIAGAGDPATKSGCVVFVYAANHSMENKSYYSSDGDLLIGAPWPPSGLLCNS